jgi:hypothetical protein
MVVVPGLDSGPGIRDLEGSDMFYAREHHF